jgi:hypothetical protein
MAEQLEPVTRELVCQLNDTEVLERGEQMAACELRAQEIKNERKRVNAALREQTDKREQLAAVIEARKETREVVCRWEPDWKRKVWLLRRSDTKDALEERAMSEADLQQRLPLAKAEAPVPIGKKQRKRSTSN